jgi:hypothetical protein
MEKDYSHISKCVIFESRLFMHLKLRSFAPKHLISIRLALSTQINKRNLRIIIENIANTQLYFCLYFIQSVLLP